MLIATFYVAIVVPYNASFVNVERPSMVGDIVVETLFIIGECGRGRVEMTTNFTECICSGKRNGGESASAAFRQQSSHPQEHRVCI